MNLTNLVRANQFGCLETWVGEADHIFGRHTSTQQSLRGSIRRHLDFFFHSRVRRQKNESGVFQLLAPQKSSSPKFKVSPIRFPDPHPTWHRSSAWWTHERCQRDRGFGFFLDLTALRSTRVSPKVLVCDSRDETCDGLG